MLLDRTAFFFLHRVITILFIKKEHHHGSLLLVNWAELQKSDNFTVASLKLWDGKEWLWHDVRIKAVRHRHLLGIMKSPSLIAKRRCHLSVPVQIKPERLPHSERVCALDLGINTLATASVVAQNGTVAQRRFFHPGADIDRRDKLAGRIRHRARKTKNLSSGFCRGIYRRIYSINMDIAEKVSRRKDGQLPGGKSSPGKSRMPITLSSLWQTPQPGESEAPLQCAA